MWTNCLIFAITKWWQEGGYIVLRASFRYWGPHAYWSKDGDYCEAVIPIARWDRAWYWIPPVLFKARTVCWYGGKEPAILTRGQVAYRPRRISKESR